MKTIKGALKQGLKIGDKTFRDFELREPSTADLFDAEDEHPASSPLKFNGALIARCLVRVGEFTGPFTFPMVRSLSKADFLTLQEALSAAEKLGEG